MRVRSLKLRARRFISRRSFCCSVCGRPISEAIAALVVVSCCVEIAGSWSVPFTRMVMSSSRRPSKIGLSSGILFLALLLNLRSSFCFSSDIVPYPMSSIDLEKTDSSSNVALSLWRKKRARARSSCSPVGRVRFPTSISGTSSGSFRILPWLTCMCPTPRRGPLARPYMLRRASMAPLESSAAEFGSGGLVSSARSRRTGAKRTPESVVSKS